MNRYNSGKEFGKKGLTVDVRVGRDSGEQKLFLEQALKVLKRRIVSEGMPKEIKRKEYHETKGQIRRRRAKDAVRRINKEKRASW